MRIFLSFVAVLTLVSASAFAADCPAPSGNPGLLFAAINKGDVAAVEQILRDTVIPPDSVNENCQLPLSLAIHAKTDALFDSLKNHYANVGAPIDFKGPAGIFPDSRRKSVSLQNWTIAFGTLHMIEVVEKSLGSVPHGATLSDTMIIAMRAHNTSDVVLHFLGMATSEDLDRPTAIYGYEGTTPFMVAAATQPLAIVQKMIGMGVNLARRDTATRTALMYAAAKSDDVAVFDELVGAGADIKAVASKNVSMLMFAVVNKKQAAALVQRLLRAGASVTSATDAAYSSSLMFGNATPNKGQTPLIIAAQCNPNVEVFRALLDAGAYVNAKDSCDREGCMSGMTALHYVAWSSPSEKVYDLALVLVNAGADITAMVCDGTEPCYTALSLARINGRTQEIRTRKLLGEVVETPTPGRQGS